MSVIPDPGVISFARGVPAPETFPVQALARASRRAIERHGPIALNYGGPAGFAPLREWLGRQHEVCADRILITPGSIMGLGFLTRLLTRESARAAVEAPTYDRMLNTLRLARVETASIDRGADGLDLAEARRLFTQRARPSFLYIMPTFHNPTGLSGLRDHAASARAAAAGTRDCCVRVPTYFLWLQLPPGLHAHELAIRAATAGVTFVPGGGFFAGARGDDGARLSFSFPGVESVRRGALELVRLVGR